MVDGIVNDPLYAAQPLKRIVLIFDDRITANKQLVQVVATTDNHGYVYNVSESGELIIE